MTVQNSSSDDEELEDEVDDDDDDEEDELVRHSGKRQIQKYSVKNGHLFLEIDGGLPVIDLRADGTIVAQANETENIGEIEEIREGVDRLGRRLSHSGAALRVSNAKYKGHQLYEMYRRDPETGGRFAAWFDESGQAQFLYFNDVLLMVKQVEAVLMKLAHLANPDLSTFEELASRPAHEEEAWIRANS